MLSSVFKAKNIPVNSERRFNSNFVLVLVFLSLFLFQNSYYVCSTKYGVSFFHNKVVRKYPSLIVIQGLAFPGSIGSEVNEG